MHSPLSISELQRHSDLSGGELDDLLAQLVTAGVATRVPASALPGRRRSGCTAAAAVRTAGRGAAVVRAPGSSKATSPTPQ